MRTVRQIHKAISAPIADLITYRAMPTHTIDHLDPFLFLNHHGPQTYGPNNNGLPFGPHPHRGFETLTFVLKGDIVHWDSSGSRSKIEAGGVQWMTAGRGLIHSEVSSEEFKKEGGEEEVLQLWMNLPAKYKMSAPKYQGIPKDEIPLISEDDGRVTVHLISGNWGDQTGPADSLTNLMMSWIDLKAEGSFATRVDTDRTVFFYVVRGKVEVNGVTAQMHNLVEFENDNSLIKVQASEESVVLFGHGEPFNEPVVAQGPFVMNSREEITQAYEDFQSGKMGRGSNTLP